MCIRDSCISVSGDFREAHNLLAIISPNPMKPRPVEYTLGKENGTAMAFLAFIEFLIAFNWFFYDGVLVMDNARIHTGGEANIVADLLWSTMVRGRPLRCLVVYLPTRSPELNPIELIFHFFPRRIRSYRYGTVSYTHLTLPTICSV